MLGVVSFSGGVFFVWLKKMEVFFIFVSIGFVT